MKIFIKNMLKIFLILIGGFLILFSILVIRTFGFPSRQFRTAQKPNPVDLNIDSISTHLATAIQYQTISDPDTSKFNETEFAGIIDYFKKSFPNVHSNLSTELVGRYSLLYSWKGQSEDLDPIIIMSHLDVVGVEPGTEDKWEHPPFSGKIIDGYIWGRGSLDDKVGVVGILEAVEQLLKKGFKPQRTIYLTFGHDEEVGGLNGAKLTAELLKSRGVKPAYILDEGGIVVEGMMPGVNAPTALVGIAEKGYLSVVLTAKSIGGHSSAPMNHTAVGRISRAIFRLEKNPMPAYIKDATKTMVEFLSAEMDFFPRILFANLWLTKGLLKDQFSKSDFTDAMIRTSTAATMITGSKTENVLPKIAKATINFRLLPGDSIQDVLAHVRNTINDPLVKVEALSMGISGGNEPSPVSDVTSQHFHILHKTIHQIFPESIVTPWQLIGSTDSKYYNEMCDNIYRFLPVQTTNSDMAGYHGINERVSVDSYEKCVRFFIQFIYNSN